MLTEIHIKNFKSIADDSIALGRVNVFIGENGCGKSNILEALAFASTSMVSNSIDKDILAGKGVRIAKPSLMVNSFKGKKQNPEICIEIKVENEDKPFVLKTYPDNDDIHSAKWIGEKLSFEGVNEKQKKIMIRELYKKANVIASSVVEIIGKSNEDDEVLDSSDIAVLEEYISLVDSAAKKSAGLKRNTTSLKQISYFLIYCLNTPALRGLTQQSLKEPVGIHGENLDVLIANFSKEENEILQKYNYLMDWLDDYMFDMQDSMRLKGYKQNLSKSRLYFTDKYMASKNNIFSSENANEGILHLLFYLAVMISKDTPKCFAIDNIESCLNPHLCRHLMTEMCKLAKENDKQVLITTHNPAILDGLNLYDDEIRLFEVKRNDKGQTQTRRIKLKPQVQNEITGETFKLSELWTRGFLGAISQDF